MVSACGYQKGRSWPHRINQNKIRLTRRCIHEEWTDHDPCLVFRQRARAVITHVASFGCILHCSAVRQGGKTIWMDLIHSWHSFTRFPLYNTNKNRTKDLKIVYTWNDCLLNHSANHARRHLSMNERSLVEKKKLKRILNYEEVDDKVFQTWMR